MYFGALVQEGFWLNSKEIVQDEFHASEVFVLE